MKPEQYSKEPVENLMHLAVGLVIVLLVMFVCLYPFIWWKKMQTRKAEQFIENYRGQEVGRDPWGTPYLVTKDDTEQGLVVNIISAGRDKNFGTEDDIKGGYRKSISVTTK